MIPTTSRAPVETSGRGLSRARVRWFAAVVFCAVLPALTVVTLFATVVEEDNVAFDFRPFYAAAESVLDGESPYPGPDDPLTADAGPYVYPPLGALVAVPFTLLPRDAAGLLVMAILVAAALGTLRALDVRDWRCYGIVLLWPPVLSAIQTGNMTLLLGLAAALAWRFRDRPVPGAIAVGASLAAKFFLWPLVVWLAATRRAAGALLACAAGAALLLASWAAIDFVGVRGYPDLLRRLEDTVGLDSYTVYVVGLDLGLPSAAARAVWLALGLGLLAAVVVVARRGDERSAFVLALAAALALTPIVWLHYFALLVVVLGLAQPRLSVAWLVPLALVITPGSGQPEPFQTAATLAIVAATVGLALHAIRREGRAGVSPEPVRAEAAG